MSDLLKYVDLDAVKQQVKDATTDLHSRLPKTDADGKPVNKKDHVVHDEMIQKFIDRAVTTWVSDAMVADLKAEMLAAVKGK